MQPVSMNIAVAVLIILSAQFARSSMMLENFYDAGEFSEPPDSADGRQRSSVRRGAVAAARSNQRRETTDWNYWRGPYRQHHWRPVGQERAQGIVFVAPPGGIEGSGGGARSAGSSRHGRTGDCLR